jgi:hypothetical protein
MSTDANQLPSTPAYLAERQALDSGLREHYDALVLDYRYYAFVHHRQPFVSYKILADLVRTGWRRNSPKH